MGCPNLSVHDYFHFVEDDGTDENGFFFVGEDETSCEGLSPSGDEKSLSGNFCEVSIDQDGNLTSDGRFTYSWDAENRLISSTPIVPSATSKKVEFTYDYMNRKTGCKIYNWTGSAWELGTTEKYAWDGMTQIAVFDASNVLKESYLWGEDLSGSLQGAGGVGGLLAVKDSSGTYILAYDGSGNIVAYVDASNSAKVAEIEYDAFGRQIVKSGIKADDFRFRFSTKPYRKETGMIEYEQRPYIPEIGRFLSRDPIGEAGGNNPYRITSNDLINKYDVLGMWGTDIHEVATRRWARNIGYIDDAAAKIGQADEAVDHGATGPTRPEGQKYHFDRPYGGNSRMTLYKEHLQKAKDACNWKSMKKDDADEALKQLGTALHPYQDWVAHGDFGMDDPGFITVIHNEHSPQKNLNEGIYGSTAWAWVDDPRLDARHSADGRATAHVMLKIVGYAGAGATRGYVIFEPGTKRFNLTKKMTDESLKEFRDFVKEKGLENCKCWQACGVKK